MEVYEVTKAKDNDYDVPMQDLSNEDDNRGYFNSNYNYKYQQAGSFVEIWQSPYDNYYRNRPTFIWYPHGFSHSNIV